MKKQKQVGFWQDMMSGANGGISSKRVLGSFILIVLLVVIVINTFWGADNHWLGEAFITMLVGAFALLGIGVFEKKHDSNNEQHYRPRNNIREDYNNYNEYQNDYTDEYHNEYNEEIREEDMCS